MLFLYGMVCQTVQHLYKLNKFPTFFQEQYQFCYKMAELYLQPPQ